MRYKVKYSKILHVLAPMIISLFKSFEKYNITHHDLSMPEFFLPHPVDHSHVILAVRWLFEPLSLDEVLVDFRVLHPRVGGLSTCHDLPHGDSKRPLVGNSQLTSGGAKGKDNKLTVPENILSMKQT